MADNPSTEDQLEARTAERDIANQALAHSEERYRLLVESVSEYAIYMLDPTGHVLSWNKGAERFKGYVAAEIIGRRYHTFFSEEDRAAGKPDRLLRRALEAGQAEDQGWRVRKDGTRFWADVVLTPMYDAAGAHIGFSKVTRDLTDRKLAEEQRRQLTLLVENVTDYAIIMLTPEGTIASWNKGAEALKGYTESEIKGGAYERFFLPEDAAAGKPRRLLARARELGHIEDEGWRQRKDGTRFWASAVITAIYDEDGVFIGYGKVTRDLTERKLAEEQRRQFELLIKNVTDYAILMLDPTGHITSWNKGVERLKGYGEQEILGKHHSLFYPPESLAEGRPAMLLATAQRDGHVEDEGWRQRKDGTRFWADVVLTAVRDEDGALIGFAKITRDLTERRQMEDMTAQAVQLQAANRIKGAFLANMSHELRTPLNAIIGYTDLVATDEALKLAPINQENLQTVLRNGRHLLSLINDVLDLSKIEAGQVAIRRAEFDPRQTIQNVLATLRPQAEAKGLALRAHLEPGLEQVHSDEVRVRQILINLVNNALKFTPEGSVDITLAGWADGRWCVSVRDTGIGIAPGHQELIFQEFKQVDGSYTRAQGGTGLGLSISRRLAELLGGELTLESTLGEGSVFTLVLPA
ncbi:MAG: PAS domain S-box protein [Candidatus Sericytochromatia bacterium]